MKHRLTVKIEKRFKRQLSKRFNSKNAKTRIWPSHKGINISCELCDEYWTEGNDINYCGECPFNVYQNKYSGSRGCLEWILRIIGKGWREVFTVSSEYIEWDKEDNKKAIELLKKLREKAKKYIVWVENTK